MTLYITTCVHGVDLRFVPRCYLCRPETEPGEMAAGRILWADHRTRCHNDNPDGVIAHLHGVNDRAEAEIERLQEQIARQAATPELAAAFDAVRAQR